MEEQRTYFVCGGGHQGLAMAAYLSLNGEKVTLWNRTREHIKDIINDGTIHCLGEIEGIAKIEKASDIIEEVISDYILVTVPSNAYADIAKKIAPYINKKTIIVLNPGRTFGAIHFAEELKKCGVKELPQIAETQTIVYTCRRSELNEVTIFAMKKDVKIAGLSNCNMHMVMDKMPASLKKYFLVDDSIMRISLSNVGMILHCAPVLMNIGWIENDKVAFKYYYDGISKTVAKYLEKMDGERLAVANKIGYSIETVADWLRRTYEITGDNLYECIKNNCAYKEIDAPPSLNSRYILEDVPNGLVPIEHIARELKVETPHITNIIELANAVYETDFRKSGRTFPLCIIKSYSEK